MEVTRLAPWFGANTVHSEDVGKQLGSLKWCGVPFCGGCPELPFIRAKAGVASDLHRHLINLAWVIREPELKAQLVDRLRLMLFHEDELAAAQRRCRDREGSQRDSLFGPAAAAVDTPDVWWAADYFASVWMGRGGHAGKGAEFKQDLSTRWTSTGGDSAKRFQSAIESIDSWHKVLRPWTFLVQNAFEMIDSMVDDPDHGIYVDPPWPDAGAEYKYGFSPADQAKLEKALRQFAHARVVVRFGDHPLIRELYGDAHWHWLRFTSKNQQNNEIADVLIINGEPR